MDYYYQQTFPHPQPALLQPKSFLKIQEKEKLKPAEKAGQQDQIILLRGHTLQVPEVKDVLTMEISYMLAREEAAIIIQETVNNM